ncbi:MAG TPA: hypothetical protein DDZ89_00475, partial [Clostridiales bacterium]|nr:hypothetical protein [Clostridiales bacterium]
KEILDVLDQRGILQSVSSKNNHEDAMKKLGEFGIQQYFLYPQISWGSKAEAINIIAEKLNISLDTFAFVDDDITEREEVRFSHPEVLLIDANDIHSILDMERLNPVSITQDAKNRRILYQSEEQRKHEEESFTGSKEEFLKTLDMKLTLSKVVPGDLNRVEELTLRTHQLNSTGYTYSYEELTRLIDSEDHLFLIAGLKDRFGDYGKIGICLLEKQEDRYTVKLLLMSCRVMNKGIGTAFLIYCIKLAQSQNKDLFAEFLHTDRNRVMYITYKMMGFEEEGEEPGDTDDDSQQVLLKYTSKHHKDFPSYLDVKAPDC